MRARHKFRPFVFNVYNKKLLMKNTGLNKNKVLETLGLNQDYKISIKKCDGFSKKVYKVTLYNKTKKVLVAVKKSLLNDLLFCKNILEKFNLNSFKLCGSYEEKGGVWIITEWIEYEKINKTKTYNLMINWLIKKDKIFTKNHKLIKDRFNKGEKWWEMIRKNKTTKLLPRNVYNKILRLKKSWYKINSVLETSPQTLCHNDFEFKNTLVSKNNSFYVFDWSRPCVGSLFIDLARLINTAPSNLNKKIINIYKKNFKCINFDFYLKTAIMRDHLSVFAALCNHINNGYRNEVDIKKFERYAKIISSY